MNAISVFFCVATCERDAHQWPLQWLCVGGVAIQQTSTNTPPPPHLSMAKLEAGEKFGPDTIDLSSRLQSVMMVMMHL